MNYKKILIIKTGAIGDFIAGTIAIKAIRDRFPEAHITLMSNSPNDLICPTFSIIDDFIEYKSAIVKSGYFGLLLRLMKERFDLAVNLKWGNDFFPFLCYLVGKKTAGSGKLTKPLYNFSPEKTVFNDPNRHEYLLNLEIAESIGFKVSEIEAFTYFGDEDVRFVNSFFEQKQINTHKHLLMAPGASTWLKAWSKERYIEIGRKFIHEFDGDVIISWAPEDRSLVEEVSSAIGDRSFMTPPTGLRQIFALVHNVKMLLCNNSGILHIAFAAKTPTVCLNTSIGWEPFGRFSTPINAFQKDKLHLNRLQNDEENAVLLRQISVDRTWDVIMEKWREFYG